MTEEENKLIVVIRCRKEWVREGEVTVNLCLNFNEDVSKNFLFAYLLYDRIYKARIEVLRTDTVQGNLQEKRIRCITFC